MATTSDSQEAVKDTVEWLVEATCVSVANKTIIAENASDSKVTDPATKSMRRSHQNRDRVGNADLINANRLRVSSDTAFAVPATGNSRQSANPSRNGQQSHYAVTGVRNGLFDYDSRDNNNIAGPIFLPPPPPSHLRMSESTIHPGYGRDSPDRTKRWSLAGGTPELRHKVDTMQAELDRLRMRNHDIANNYQKVLRELEGSLESRQHMEATLAEQREHFDTLKQQYDLGAQEKQLLQQQLLDLRLKLDYKSEELADLRGQLRGEPAQMAFADDVANANTSASTFATVAQHGLDNTAWMDDILKQWEEVRRENDARRIECDQLREQVAMYEEECRGLHRQLEVKESKEARGLYEQLHKLTQERNLHRSRCESLAQQVDEARIEINRAYSLKQRLEEDLDVLRAQYDSMHNDYKDTMRERSDVLEENNRMHDSVKTLEEQNAALRSKLSGVSGVGPEHIENYYASVPVMDPRSVASSESEIADLTHRALEKEMTDLRQKLALSREEVETGRSELSKAASKRDWALKERERTLSERDSIRNMCDQLRRERDEAITSLAKAINDSDDLQRQREKAERELKELKDRLLAQGHCSGNENGNGQQPMASPSNSRDSAIDADMAEWDVETLQLNMAGSKEDLGIELAGGRDDPQIGIPVPVYVKSVTKGSKLDGHIRVYDCITQVNDIDVSNMEHRSVMDILRNGVTVKMVIKRRRLIGMKLISVPLDQSFNDSGIALENGVYIGKIRTGSAAARAGNLAIGDRVVYVNDIPVHDKSADQVARIVSGIGTSGLILAVMKSPPVLSPMTPSTSFNTRFSNGNKAAPTSCFDKQVQANISINGSDLTVSNNTTNKSKGNLLDKVHDRIFGLKTEKKPKPVVAQAKLDNSAEILRSRHGSLRFSLRDDTRRCSLRTPLPQTSFSAASKQYASRDSDSGLRESEKMLFRTFDEFLDGQDDPATLTYANIGRTQAEGVVGSTWPKLRDNLTAATNGAGNQEPIGASTKRKVQVRPSIIPVFPSPQTQQRGKHGQNGEVQQSQMPPGQASFASDGSGTTPSSGISSARSSQSPGSQQHHPFQQQQQNMPRPASYFTGSPQHANSVIYEKIPVSSGSRPTSAALPANVSNSVKTVPIYEDVFGRNSQAAGVHVAQATDARVAYTPVQMRVVYARPVDAQSPSNLNPASNCSSPFSKPPPYPGLSGARASPDLETLSIGSSVSNPSLPRSIYRGNRGNAMPRMSPFQEVNQYARRDSSNEPPSLALGKPRRITVERQSSSSKINLGISIESNGNGVFVASVNEGSLAARHGVHIGDQILDVCGVNMRLADLQKAERILGQVCQNDEITLLMRYNPQMLRSAASLSRDSQQSHSQASTPRATPYSFFGDGSGPLMGPVVSAPARSLASRADTSSIRSASAATRHSREILAAMQSGNTSMECNVSQEHYLPEPRWLYDLKKGTMEENSWGFRLIGGNAVGVFVDHVHPRSQAAKSGLQLGDMVMTFNGVDFRRLTLEQANCELDRLEIGTVVNSLVQYNEAKYNRIKRGDCGDQDSFYVRVNIDRPNQTDDELNLTQGVILYVDSTRFMGQGGIWRAWSLDQEGRQKHCGLIPAKYKLEEEFILKRSGSETSGAGENGSEGGSRRGTIRRSLKFIRRSSRSSQHQHSRNPSKDSGDTIGDVALLDELYQRVERLDLKKKRPVLLIGALVEPFVVRLVDDYPQVFAQCIPECPDVPRLDLEQKLKSGAFIDLKKRDKIFEVTTLAAVKTITDKGYHCILDVGPPALEKLHDLQIYPIVIKIKFKSPKQIKELKEATASGERVNSKLAKELLEKSEKLDLQLANINCQTTTITVPTQHTAHQTVNLVCHQILSAVEHEQKKPVWIISSDNI